MINAVFLSAFLVANAHAKPLVMKFENPKLEEQLLREGTFRSYIISDLIHICAVGNARFDCVPQTAQIALDPSTIDESAFTLHCKEEQSQSLLQGMRERLRRLRERGVTMDDLYQAKDKLGNFLEKMRARGIKAKEFMDHYLQQAEKITPEQVNYWAKQHLNDEKISFTPEPTYKFASPEWEYTVSPCNDVNFLHISHEKEEAIYTIIKTMGTKGLFGLLKDRKKLEALGDRIQDVPPLQFLGYIFSNPELKGYMPKIAKSSFKWSNLIGGVKRTLNAEWDQGVVQPQINGFAEFLGANADDLRRYLEEHNVDGFVKSLF